MGKVLSAMAFPRSTFSIFSFPVLVFVCCHWVGNVGIGSMKQELIDILFTSLVAFLFLSLSPIDLIWVEGFALQGRSGKALSI